MAVHFKSSRVTSEYGVVSACLATDWLADGPYMGSGVPATLASLNCIKAVVRSVKNSVDRKDRPVLAQFIILK